MLEFQLVRDGKIVSKGPATVENNVNGKPCIKADLTVDGDAIGHRGFAFRVYANGNGYDPVKAAARAQANWMRSLTPEQLAKAKAAGLV